MQKVITFSSDMFAKFQERLGYIPHTLFTSQRTLYVNGNKIIKHMGVFLTILGSASDLVFLATYMMCCLSGTFVCIVTRKFLV